MGYLGCPCPLGTPKAGGSIPHARWMRQRSPCFPRASCQLLTRQLLPAEKAVIKNQVSGITWPDALLHLKAWLTARLALKFSLSGPYFVNGSPKSAALLRNKMRLLGSKSLRTAVRELAGCSSPSSLATAPHGGHQTPAETAGTTVQAAVTGVWTSSGSTSHHRLSR